jgi:hypothetical protein
MSQKPCRQCREMFLRADELDPKDNLDWKVDGKRIDTADRLRI